MLSKNKYLLRGFRENTYYTKCMHACSSYILYAFIQSNTLQIQCRSNKLLSSRSKFSFESKDCAKAVFTTEALQSRFIEAHVTCHPQH